MRNVAIALLCVSATVLTSLASAQVSITSTTWIPDWTYNFSGGPGSANFQFGPLTTNGNTPGELKVTLNKDLLAMTPNEAGHYFYTVSGMVTLKTGANPVRFSDMRYGWNYEMKHFVDRAESPTTYLNMSSRIWLLSDDKDGSESYTFGEDLVDPQLESGATAGVITGNQADRFVGAKTFGGSAYLKPNALYVYETTMLIDTKLIDGQFATEPKVELRGDEFLWNVKYETVPEPATMAVLGLGAAALLRKRKGR